MPELEPITREEKFLNGEVGMTPITREEKILAGEDIETVTRREYFLKKYRGGGGGDVTVVPLSVTDNGTYSEEGKAYSPVSVNVPLPQNAYLLKSVNTPTPIASFNDGEDMVMPSLKVAIEPQQEGSGDPSPTNIRPISGWDECNVTDIDDITNKSFFDGLLNGTYGVVDLGSLTWSHASSNRSISNAIANTIKKPATQTSLANLLTSNIYTQVPSNTSLNTNGQFAISQSGDMIFYYDGVNEPKGYMVYELATPITPTVTPSEINELYEEFGINGHTYTIDLDGTRYGGTLDVVSGVLTVDRAYVDLGTLDYSLSSSISVFYSTITNMKAPSTSADRKNGIISSMFPVSNSTSISASMDDKSMLRDAGAIYIRDTDYNDTTAFKTAMNGVQLVYELATPLTIQLTPTAVKSLRGVNNVYANTGDIKDAEYFSKEV